MDMYRNIQIKGEGKERHEIMQWPLQGQSENVKSVGVLGENENEGAIQKGINIQNATLQHEGAKISRIISRIISHHATPPP